MARSGFQNYRKPRGENMVMNHRKRNARNRARAFAFCALFPLSLPVVAAMTIAVVPLLVAAKPAAAQDFPEEYDWPSSQSRITGVKMPAHTIRMASGTTAYPA